MFIDTTWSYQRQPIYGRQNITLLAELVDSLAGSINISPLRGVLCRLDSSFHWEPLMLQ